jgi:hypothetical protein
MGFNLEDKIRWEELAPSLQKKFADLEKLIKETAESVDIANGATFKSWNMKMWETSHIFTDLSFYETMRVTQSGSNNKITTKTYNNILGNMYAYPTLSSQAMWIKHQLPFTASDGVHRLYLGGRDGVGGGVIIFRSDEEGLKFTKVANLPGNSIWDMVEFRGAMFVLVWADGVSTIYKTSDGLNYTRVQTVSTSGGHAKTICVYQNILYVVTIGRTYYTSDGVNWQSSGNNISGSSQVYSRYCTENKIYIGTAGDSAVWVSSDGFRFSRLWDGAGHSYTRWICAWTPKNNADHPNQEVEYIIWGTGGSGNEVGTACLMMYDPVDNRVYTLFNFRGDNYPADSSALNYGHAPIEPAIANSASPTGYIPAGFRERQIRYIEVFENDYTGESFLIVGTSDCHFYSDHKNNTLYYQECNYNNNTVKPLVNDEGNYEQWTSGDKEAWMTDNVTGPQSPATYMGNVYAVGPRNAAAFRKNDLVVTLVKHTEDTRVYSMAVFKDPDNVKWVYAGTGGGNYSGKGLLYRFGYSDMLDLIEAAKIGAIFPPRWAIEGQVNKRVRQDGTRLFLKIMGGCSARESYTEMKFAFSKNFIKSTAADPYIMLIANQYNSANCYIMKYYPLKQRIDCIVKVNNVEKIVKSVSAPLSLYNVSEKMESVNAPEMGPFYMMAIEVGAGALNPNSTSSFDKYLYNSLDGKVTFYFKLSNTRDDILTDSSIAATYNINYAGGERKNIGIYGLQTFDCPGLYLISSKQCSLYKHQLDSANQSLEGSGEIVFGVY